VQEWHNYDPDKGEGSYYSIFFLKCDVVYANVSEGSRQTAWLSVEKAVCHSFTPGNSALWSVRHNSAEI